jgi:hypothetical protein
MAELELTAERFARELDSLRSAEELAKIQRYFKSDKGQYGEGDIFIGVRPGHVFDLAKLFLDMPPAELETLLESPIHEKRAGALSIMGRDAARKKTPETRRKALFDLYLRRHGRINNWDLVDLGAPQVVGRHLIDKPRDVLYGLARSTSLWERRTAIIATLYFQRQGQLDDSFAIAEILLGDDQDLIHKAAGGLLREGGKRDRPRLIGFLDAHAATMPRTLLRYAIEHLSPDERVHYLGLRKATGA